MIKFILKHFFLFCLLVIGSLFYYLTMTTPGLQTDIQIITRIFTGKLRIGSAEGKLVSNFSLKNISWQDRSETIHIQSLSLGWDPRGLLLHQFVINSLNIDHAIIIIPSLTASSNTTKNDKSFSDFFKNIIVKQARLNQISIQLANAEINLHGTLQKNWDLQWKANLPEAGSFLKNSKGSLSMMGSITGPFFTPNLIARFRGKNIVYANQKINDLDVAINILANPDMTAHFNLSSGEIRIPVLGITPRAIHLQGNITLTKKLDFSGTFISGKGHAELRGSIDFNHPNYPIVLQVKGSQLQAVNLPEYNILISPDITLNFARQNLKVQGTILIPSAEITPQNFSSTVTLPGDVVFVHAKKTPALPFTTRLQLTLTLGNKIHLTYHDLTADLGGNVHITQLPGTPINAVGELYTKKGSYTAYGQTLKIQTGRLIYTGGSLMNPGLTISAVKKLKTVNTGGNVSHFSGTTSLQPVYTGTQSITVGIEVLGTLDNPVFNLYSSPAMAQTDILSYLVFGFPQSQASGNQYGAILSALSSLNPNTASASHFTKNLQEKWGLTEMSVESVQVFNPNATSSSNSVVSATSFVVGKKLSHNLSIHYSVGLFYPVSILNLRYKLAKHWAIQSETSTLDNGADVFYTIERD